MDRAVPKHLAAALVLCCCAAAAAAAVVWPPANQELIHSARYWEAHERADLALLALKKLVAARPDSPDALLALGELDLRINDFAAAAHVEGDLARRFPGSSAASEFANEYRIETRDRLLFASIRRLVEIGRGGEGFAALGRLFPGGPPGEALGIDYYLLLASTPNGLAPACRGMQRLAGRHPDDPRYQLALGQLMVRQRETALAGVELLQQLVRRDDVRTDDADRLLASGISRLGAERAPPQAVDAYLARHPADPEMTALRNEQARAVEERALLSSATLSEALPDLQRRLSKDLTIPSGSASAGAGAAALVWLERSRGSLLGHREALAAAELRAALAFSRGDYESQIPIAPELEAQGAVQEGGELLADAARLAPQSSWLFETQVRWLIAHGRAAQAAELIRGRAFDQRWTARSRDPLLASALAQQASEQADAGRTDAAAADLEEAVPLAPRDAWMRYRLAEYYRGRGEADRGRRLMSEGADIAPELPEMRYAQALYLSRLEDYPAAYAVIDAVEPGRRTEGMNALHDRMRVALARAAAKREKAAGDLDAARAALLDAEPVASHGIERAAELAYAWIDLGSAAHGLGLVEPYVQGPGAADPKALLTWAEVLNSAEDEPRLRTALAQLRAIAPLEDPERAGLNRLQRAFELREVRDLEHRHQFDEAARRLDALLARDPHDRELRVARADLSLAAGRPRKARDRYASLVAEDPDDLDTRLSYVRALAESGDTAIARAQLRAVEDRLPANDAELRINLARRQLALGDAAKALVTLRPLLAASPPRADVLMLAGRAELAERRFAAARGYFDQAAPTADDALGARHASREIEDRLESNMAAGVIVRHQPGAAGMSQLDAVTIPSSWLFAENYESRFTARADAVGLDAGRWSGNPQSLPQIGTLPGGSATALRYTSDRQAGVSPSVGYQTDSLSLDVGATPLGFLLTNAVGGIEWTPTWHSANLTLGLARRAVTSSELSYAGLRDPITGTPWGGVVQTGPYAGFGVYRERYAVSGSVQLSEMTGTRVLDNQFAGARLSTSWKFLSLPDTRADAGVTVNYWNYQHNLSNYTFGSGGYYSPQSYVSISTPIELDGSRAGWVYRLRAAASYSISQVDGSAFYPDDAALQAAAARAPPAGYATPYFSGYHSGSFGFTAYAAAEHQLTRGFVIGFMIDIDRTDFYHPTTGEIYLRHAFGPRATRTVTPPRPTPTYDP